MTRRSSFSFLLALATPLAAQWINYPAPGVPRTRDGKPNLAAHAPHLPGGKTDFSGIWQAESSPGPPEGTNGDPLPTNFLDVTHDLAPQDLVFQPWAAALFKQRTDGFGKDDPISRCLPLGVPRRDADALPFKIVQTRGLMILLQEGDASFRQVFLDGRPLPKDPQPSWMGYSVGTWDGDALVVETVGLRDQGWLDGLGHPHSDALRVVERFRRRDFGHMEIQITIDDPKAYQKPFSYTQQYRLTPDNELLENICLENERDSKHLVGK